jgi:hypothetical protein
MAAPRRTTAEGREFHLADYETGRWPVARQIIRKAGGERRVLEAQPTFTVAVVRDGRNWKCAWSHAIGGGAGRIVAPGFNRNDDQPITLSQRN